MTLKNFYKNQLNRTTEKYRDRRRSGLLAPLIVAKYDELKQKQFKKTKEEENILYQALINNEFLKNVLTDTPLKNVIDLMYQKDVKEGDLLMEQGKINSHCFVSKSGKYEISENGKLIETFNGIRVFGEVSILHRTKTNQTVKSTSPGVVFVLDSTHFKKLSVDSQKEKQDQIVSYLRNVPNISTAPEDRLYTLANVCKDRFYPQSSLLVKEGQIVSKFFVITAGSATILTRDSSRKPNKLTKGDFFGENIFLKETVSLFSIVADSPGLNCLVVYRQNFLEHFGDIEEFLYGKSKVSVNVTRVQKYENLELKNLKKLKTLGLGGFGRVELVQDSKHKYQVFALKLMKKNEISGQSQIDQVYNEKNIQISCDSPFIVRLYRTFKDPKYIYFLLEPCLGGDLWNLLRRQRMKSFDTDATKFYTGCIVEAFSYLHSKDIVYRDLKPENVMVASNGYLKLTDFGFAKKMGPNEKSYSFVGTAEYVAPELVQNLGHDRGVDYWALGIFIYELLAGKSPFRNDEHNDLKTYKAILRGIDFINFPYVISPRARNLIKKLCRPLAADRLGCLKNGVDDIRDHPWFSKLDWEKLRRLELEPPIKIPLHGNTDTRYFENFKEEPACAIEDFSTWDKDF